MAAAGHPGEDAALYDTVRAVAMELCPALGISIPVGKDSMSMRTTWRDDGDRDKAVTAPLSLIVSAFAPVARRAARADAAACGAIAGDTELAAGSISAPARQRLGGSALAQVYGQLGDDRAGPRRSGAPRRLLRRDPGAACAKACCSRITTSAMADSSRRCAEMAFASRCGLEIALDAVDAAIRWRRCSPRSWAPSCRCDAANRAACRAAVRRRRARRPCDRRTRRATNGSGFARSGTVAARRSRASISIAPGRRRRTRCSGCATIPECADEEYARIADATDPGLAPVLTFDPAEDIAAPFIATGARPAIAILREQGVNGQVEMAAAFDRAGFAAIDVHMTDILAGRRTLADFRGFVACGGFLLRRRARARARAGPSRSCSTRARATTSRRSSRATTRSRSASATAAR